MAKGVQPSDRRRIFVGASHQGHGDEAGLPQGLLGERTQRRPVDLSQANGSLKAAGMGKATGWEGRVGELEEDPVHGGGANTGAVARERTPFRALSVSPSPASA